MDYFLGTVTSQAMNYAIKSGISITASFAIQQSTRLLKTIEGTEKDELQDLQQRLNSKIRIISPAIDMIELISARGNTSLESAVSLTNSLRWEIQNLGQRLTAAANSEELIQRKSYRAKDRDQFRAELRQIIVAIQKLLARIEDAVPLINLAIAASGANLSSTLPSTVSPSRLLQASTFLTAGDSQYAGAPLLHSVQIGPSFTLSMYMLFVGHIRPQNEEDVRQSTWKEVIHKANVRLLRVPLDSLYEIPGQRRNTSEHSEANDFQEQPEDPRTDYFPSHVEGQNKADEYAYQLSIIEDLDDDRMHAVGDHEEPPSPCEDVMLAGIRETVPIHELSKIFYADTGKILNIGNEGEPNNPILLLKRDVNAIPPRRLMERLSVDETLGYAEGESLDAKTPLPDPDNGTAQEHVPAEPATPDIECKAVLSMQKPWRLPPDLDPEWMAFEVYSESPDSDSESEPPISPAAKAYPRNTSMSSPTDALSRLHLSSESSSPQAPSAPTSDQSKPDLALPPVQTSLSLLEVLLRLLSLQQFQQAPHLSIPDELLTFFLSESASTGADGEERKRIRQEARRHVGFDPYDESPVKRRGEEYQYQRPSHETWQGNQGYGKYETYDSDSPAAQQPGRNGTPLRYDERYETYAWEKSSRHSPSPSPFRRHSSSPRTPPLLLKNKANPKSSAGSGRPARLQNFLTGERDAIRRGSPLARPSTGLTDEGIGTSPTSSASADQRAETKYSE